MYTIGGNEIRVISITFISNIYHLLVLKGFKVFCSYFRIYAKSFLTIVKQGFCPLNY